jgi:cytochrome c oxidase subunit 2
MLPRYRVNVAEVTSQTDLIVSLQHLRKAASVSPTRRSRRTSRGPGTDVRGDVPGRARRPRRAAARGAALLVPVLLGTAATGCTAQEFGRLGMPEPISEQGERILTLWQGSWIAAFAVGIVVWGLIIWAVIFHRKRSDVLPPQVRYNLPIEILYTVVPFIMIAVLFYFTARDQNYLQSTSGRPDVTVYVTGFQWSWQFDYCVGASPPRVDQCPTKRSDGTPVSVVGQAGGKPVLVVPAGRTIRFKLDSPDVIHSFWVPSLLYKLDVIPGHPNTFQVKLKPDDRPHTYEGRCAELCGVDHSRMLFQVLVVPQGEFPANPDQLQRFVDGRQPAGVAQ